jgi:hypothetical protein
MWNPSIPEHTLKNIRAPVAFEIDTLKAWEIV